MSKRPHRRRKSRAQQRSGLPKGAHRLPGGGIVMVPVVGPADQHGRRIVIRTVRRDPPDLKLLAHALLEAAPAEQGAPHRADSDSTDQAA